MFLLDFSDIGVGSVVLLDAKNEVVLNFKTVHTFFIKSSTFLL